jgi:hypothetical protein
MQSKESIGRSAINKKKYDREKYNAIKKINREKCNQSEEMQQKEVQCNQKNQQGEVQSIRRKKKSKRGIKSIQINNQT